MIRTKTQTPVDANDKPIAGAQQAGTRLAVTYDATISSATSITLNAATTSFEVTAIDKPLFLRYAASVSTTEFDALIPANTTRTFFKQDGVTVISVLEASATANVAVIEY